MSSLSVPKPAPNWDTLNIARAPLVPLAVAGTCGIIADRFADVPLPFSLLVAAIFPIVWSWAAVRRERGPTHWFLWMAVAAGGAAYHHWHCQSLNEDDIAHLVNEEPRPIWLRGVVGSEPRVTQKREDPLSAFPESTATRFLLETTQYRDRSDWRNVSGLVQTIVEGELAGVEAGDSVEVVGQIATPEPPGNPGEFDYIRYLRDRRIRAVLQVRKTTTAVTRLDRLDTSVVNVSKMLAKVRSWAKAILVQNLPSHQQGVAIALLLGDESGMSDADWEKYMHTGVVHVLAISGQHLAVLGGFVWLVLRLFRVRRRTAALCVSFFVLAYALLVGGQPPVLRAAGMVVAMCGALWWQRLVLTANSFAFAWILVALVNPTAIFNNGCQLSFLAVAMLFWGMSLWNRSGDVDPLEKIEEENRPLWRRLVLKGMHLVLIAYVVNLAVWLAVTPLIADRHHLVSPVSVLIGPPMILFSSVALLTGFLLLLGGCYLWPLSAFLASIMSWSLSLTDFFVSQAADMPFACFHVPDVPIWMLWLFYLGVFAFLMIEPLRRHWTWAAGGSLIWCGVLSMIWVWPRDQSFRCSFVAVGHGSCILLETRGKVLLYDAGAITGPDVTRRTVAPYLWSRGIAKIDELFLSHADLDHFNGVPALLQRFAVGRIHWTPTFSEREAPGVRRVLDAIRTRGVATTVLSAGKRLQFADVSIDVLHPPEVGPPGKENARSLVLLCRSGAHSILLTGDLEEEGLKQFLETPSTAVDVLMAPHHGSKTANTPALAACWPNPKSW